MNKNIAKPNLQKKEKEPIKKESINEAELEERLEKEEWEELIKREESIEVVINIMNDMLTMVEGFLREKYIEQNEVEWYLNKLKASIVNMLEIYHAEQMQPLDPCVLAEAFDEAPVPNKMDSFASEMTNPTLYDACNKKPEITVKPIKVKQKEIENEEIKVWSKEEALKAKEFSSLIPIVSNTSKLPKRVLPTNNFLSQEKKVEKSSSILSSEESVLALKKHKGNRLEALKYEMPKVSYMIPNRNENNSSRYWQKCDNHNDYNISQFAKLEILPRRIEELDLEKGVAACQYQIHRANPIKENYDEIMKTSVFQKLRPVTKILEERTDVGELDIKSKKLNKLITVSRNSFNQLTSSKNCPTTSQTNK